MALLAWIGSHIEAPEPQALAPGFAATTARLSETYLSTFEYPLFAQPFFASLHIQVRTGENMNEWWRDAVIYQIYPRSYQDDSGDGIGDL
ncbi:MAG: hypothetical protein ABJI41_07025, partial [Erythrobacter sp.]